ncbi:hypothetical protein MLD38_039619 [Melastoma candidum]|uniref:Uncharacterized protein n=1 Tax=Melastoma candidum TaxID=119954 RepID=A0ACB9L3J0_9MYRT|nr:hypothetical protein MLD38_039619 [Melastoma candidum]
MALLLLRRAPRPSISMLLLARLSSSKSFSGKARDDELRSLNGGHKDFASHSSGVRLSPLFDDTVPASLDIKRIEVVDAETWKVSAALSRSWLGASNPTGDQVGLGADATSCDDAEEDFDRIDDMRVKGNLFYKLEKSSKEFEEYSLEFHRRKPKTGKEDPKEMERKERPHQSMVSDSAKFPEAIKKNSSMNQVDALADPREHQSKKLRSPTFNQLTGPYHEPFCLDIYISKASVRACIIHRVTSKVVAVAHSISKDMKFDLGSSRNVKTASCAAVGEILARRALEDDIHDVLYIPRKGDKLEGKLMVVLQAIISGGVNVKVKLKQRKGPKKDFNFSHNARP